MINIKFRMIEGLSGTLYFIPDFIKCVYCGHEIPTENITSFGTMVVDRGGCGKASNFLDYAKYFGVIKNVQEER